MKYFVTLFDSNYLIRGLALYRSLVRHAGPFHLWIVCFDDLAYRLLQQFRLDAVTLVSLAEFEDAELRRVKSQRTWQEYCWTATPSTLTYVFSIAPHVDALTYVDADLMFFSSVQPLFDEAAEASILLTRHHFSPHLTDLLDRGIYNVQFMLFRRDAEGMRAVEWWRERCIEWCFNRLEDDKFGDQKYLDDWPTRFSQVQIVHHPGAGVAPWNVDQYKLDKVDSTPYIENMPLIFYHFHNVLLHRFHLVYVCNNARFRIDRQVQNIIYKPYLRELSKARRDIRRYDHAFACGQTPFPEWPTQIGRMYQFLKHIAYEIKEGHYHVY